MKVNSLICFLLFFFLISCQTKFDLPISPPPLPCCILPDNVRVALVLGGGGFRGLSHVGVLQALEEANIPIDLIVGCSAGAIVGSLYADTPNASYVRKIVTPLRAWDLLDINVLYARYGLVQGRSLSRFLTSHLSCHYFEELQIPLCIVATDIMAGNLACFTAGPLIPPVRASCAVPFIFSPVYLYKRWLVDGGVIDPVPVKTAKEYGATIVIAVDLCRLLPRTCPNNLFGIAARATEIALSLHSANCVEGAEIVIRPELGDMGIFDDCNPDHVYEAGYRAAYKVLPQIIDLLIENGISV